MEILDILEFPDPRLRIKSEPVEEVNEALQNLAAEMAVTMYANSGIGLAAPQVNVHKRKSACIQHEMDHFDGKIIIDYIAS